MTVDDVEEATLSAGPESEDPPDVGDPVGEDDLAVMEIGDVGAEGWFGIGDDQKTRQRWVNDETPLEISFRNVGGISEESITIPPGVTLLVGENATNRTSLLEGLGAALGGETGAVKAGAETGEVTLTAGDTTVSVTLSRTETGVQRTYDAPWERSPEYAAAVTNFVVLNESNPIRQAVRTGAGELYELIMAPVDTAEIDAAIERLERERSELRERIEWLEEKRERLPGLEERRQTLEGEIESVKADLEAVEADIEEYELDRAEAETQSEQMDEYERLLDDRERLQTALANQRETLEEVIADREEKQAELDGFEFKVSGEYGSIEAVDEEIERVKAEVEELDEMESLLRRLVSTTEELLATEDQLREVFGTDQDVTELLAPGSEEFECWTCGSVVKRNTIDDRKQTLQELAQSKRTERAELEAQLDDLEAVRSNYERQQRTRDRLEDDLENLDRQIRDLEADIEGLEQRLGEVETEIDAIEDDLEATETDDHVDALVEAYQRRGELRNEAGQLNEELASVENEIESIEDDVAELESVREERDRVESMLEQYRDLVDEIEQAVIAEFNDRMATVLEFLEYENIARVWLERRQPDDDPVFELHVVRETDDGAVFEDRVAHLSESEREVVGLIVAVAGYLAHSVSTRVPVLLLDSIEAIDANRIDRLIEWLQEETATTYLVAALLKEDASALPDAYHRIRPAATPAGD